MYAISIGLRYFRSKKRSAVSVISFVAVTGVALGVGALLCVMSITAGFQDEFRDKVLGVNAHVLVLKYGLDFGEYRRVIARAKAMPEVQGAAPFEINEMMLARGDRLSGVLVKGVDPGLMPEVLDLPSQLEQGSLVGLRKAGAVPPSRANGPRDPEDLEHDGDWHAWLESLRDDPDLGQAEPSRDVPPIAPSAVASPEDMSDWLSGLDDAPLEDAVPAEPDADGAVPDEGTDRLPGIVVGVTLAETLGAHVGDRVQVISPLAGIDPSLVRANPGTPRSADFRVIGVFRAGFQEYDSRLVYVDLYEAQALADRGDTVTGVEIRLRDLTRARSVSRRLERELGGAPYHTLDWQELNHNLFTALEIQKTALSLVIATIIFVAAFNVIATLIMIVMEKKREIAILKAMGAKDSSVLGIFLLQGTIIGVIGTALGLLLGSAICFSLEKFRYPLDPKVYLIDHLPVRTSAVEFVLTVAIALSICVTATLIPSWWAARMLPADGVRYS